MRGGPLAPWMKFRSKANRSTVGTVFCQTSGFGAPYFCFLAASTHKHALTTRPSDPYNISISGIDRCRKIQEKRSGTVMFPFTVTRRIQKMFEHKIVFNEKGLF